jgi:hypothetical protein
MMNIILFCIVGLVLVISICIGIAEYKVAAQCSRNVRERNEKKRLNGEPVTDEDIANETAVFHAWVSDLID